MELGRLAASAQVLLGEDVASFDVVVWLQREHSEEDEAKTLDLFFGLWVTRKRYLFKQISFSVSFFQDIFSLFQSWCPRRSSIVL